MDQYYEVYDGSAVVGKVQLTVQGLYYHIMCRCFIPDDRILHLFVVTDNLEEGIGVLVPENDGVVLNKKIPIKRIGRGALRFYVSTGKSKHRGRFAVISPEEPFLYIDRLNTAFLQSEHGKIGIRLEENPEAG